MDTSKLNLVDAESLRNLELGYPVHEAISKIALHGDMRIGKSVTLQEMVGNPFALSQDAFRAVIIRQGRVSGTF